MKQNKMFTESEHIPEPNKDHIDTVIFLGQYYMDTHTRTQFTDDLHDAFGFRTDYEIIKKSQMNHILKLSKDRKNITTIP